MKLRCIVATLITFALSANQTFAQVTECNNGLDDDGDGKVDALIELPAFNGERFTSVGNDPFAFSHATIREIQRKKFPINIPTSAFIRSDGPTEHLPTLQQVCRIFGFRDYVSSGCIAYPYQSRCNFLTPHNNTLSRFGGYAFADENATGKTWLSSITCMNRLAACSDGWDNDGDGKIDRQDPDCLTDNDNSELPKDPKCKTPSDPTEFEQCRNKIDDDGDNLIDAADPGCWKTPGVPASYDPNIDDERLNPQCSDGIDNDHDGAIDLADFSCSKPNDNDEKNPKAQCQDGIDNDKDGEVDLHDPGCSSNQDNDEYDRKPQCRDGIDNDHDGAIDMKDFSCSGPNDDDESDPKAQCQDCIDNDHDGHIDLDDPGCSSPQDNDEYDKKPPCKDGKDNDLDGAIDKDDACCRHDESDESEFLTQCQDKRDNDGDNLIDQRDPGCATSQDDDESDPMKPLTLSFECVRDNKNGTFTAYFGYENLNSAPIFLWSDSRSWTLNEFTPGSANRGQPTAFMPGVRRGDVAVTFEGSEITWAIRTQGGAFSSVTASRSSKRCKMIEPHAECRSQSNGRGTVVFGYSNPNPFAIDIDEGELNSAISGYESVSPPTRFEPGVYPAAFSTSFSSNATWSVDGNRAGVSASTSGCSAPTCSERATGAIRKNLIKTANNLRSLTKKMADLIRRENSRSTGSKTSAQTSASVASTISRIEANAISRVLDAAGLAALLPEKMTSCTEVDSGCQTIDHTPVIKLIASTFSDQLAQLKRLAKSAPNASNTTKKTLSNMAAEGSRLKALADNELGKCPRSSTECG